ncbi:hypothetical protein M080_5273, partial [Bacteroides fragilis str. 3397 T10]
MVFDKIPFQALCWLGQKRNRTFLSSFANDYYVRFYTVYNNIANFQSQKLVDAHSGGI